MTPPATDPHDCPTMEALANALLDTLADLEQEHTTPLIERGLDWRLTGDQADRLHVTCTQCPWTAEGTDEEELDAPARAHVITCQPTPTLSVAQSTRRLVQRYREAHTAYQQADPNDHAARQAAWALTDILGRVVADLAEGYGVHPPT